MTVLRRMRTWVAACVVALGSTLIAVPTAVAASPVVPCISKPFSDVTVGSPFCRDIAWLKAQGITEGYGDGTFNPTGTVTREAMSAFLYRLANPGRSDPGCVGSTPASDVSISNQFCGTITWLTSKNITQAVGGFNPSADVSRAAMSAFLYRLANPGKDDPSCSSSPFNDVAVGNQFCGTISWLATKGISEGYDDGGFHPGDPVSREAMAAFLHRTATILLTTVKLGVGTVTVGAAIAPGRYLITSGTTSSIQITQGEKITISETVGSGGVPSVTVSLNVGDRVSVKGSAAIASPTGDRLRSTLTTGIWLVGRDISPGTYDASPGKGQSGTLSVVPGKTYLLKAGASGSSQASATARVTLKAGDVIYIEAMASVRFAAAT